MPLSADTVILEYSSYLTNLQILFKTNLTETKRLYWLPQIRSQVRIETKLLNKTILKPVCTYGSIVDMLPCYQNLTLILIINALKFVSNQSKHNYLYFPKVKDEKRKYFKSHLNR